jgi:hypothetical protein
LPVDVDHVVLPLDPLRSIASVLGFAVVTVVAAVVAVHVVMDLLVCVCGVALSGMLCVPETRFRDSTAGVGLDRAVRVLWLEGRVA